MAWSAPDGFAVGKGWRGGCGEAWASAGTPVTVAGALEATGALEAGTGKGSTTTFVFATTGGALALGLAMGFCAADGISVETGGGGLAGLAIVAASVPAVADGGAGVAWRRPRTVTNPIAAAAIAATATPAMARVCVAGGCSRARTGPVVAVIGETLDVRSDLAGTSLRGAGVGSGGGKLMRGFVERGDMGGGGSVLRGTAG
jgi:hypothetical protein